MTVVFEADKVTSCSMASCILSSMLSLTDVNKMLFTLVSSAALSGRGAWNKVSARGMDFPGL